ncbi:aspartic peptidase domain-containing protein [Diplogelasinospora grovesii]|uniref:Aspartic peptidase domain-containing protein n=1 Tax=Diplogelasinospora grovesii TaxID=303347 RepID=A0AAN6NGZ1_9PEZI|nr:aspartic peptidase domain-containing protein [Diplogelasinospora grovesii]
MAASTPCEVKPLHLPITDIQVLPNISDSFVYGIPASVGTPAENIVLLPWADLNGTWIYDQNAFCDHTVIWSDLICDVRRGNLYIESNSASFQKYNDIFSAGGPDEVAIDDGEAGIAKLTSTGLGGTDSITFGSNPILPDYPIGVPRIEWDSGYTIQHSLGLGRNSTYLNHLAKSGQIAGKVWSIFWGRMWTSDNPMDGQDILGGYDTGCWTGMKVQLIDINLNFRAGPDVSIFPSNTALSMCIVPQDQLTFTAPGKIRDQFEAATGMVNAGWSYDVEVCVLMPGGGRYDGDMTLKFSTGLEIRIPNNQMLVPFVTFDRNGSRIFNESQRELTWKAGGTDPPTLGRYFLTAAYLMVDHDAGSFTLWQANPTNSTNPVSVVSADVAKQCGGNATGAVVQPSASASASASAIPGGSSGTPSTGLIAGIVVASVLGTAAIGAAIYMYFRFRRRTGSAEQQQAPEENKGPEMTQDRGTWQTHPSELTGSDHIAPEVQGQSHFVHELDGSGGHYVKEMAREGLV